MMRQLNWPKNLCFKHPWRAEQQRVIDHIFTYLDDKRLHLVAAPGAGKTVVGLEVFNRLQLKTLVVSPTRLIRDQWLQRLEDFVPNWNQPSWFATNLHGDHLLISTTYQALFSLDQTITKANTCDVEQRRYQCISQWFAEHDIGLLIVDEAHHLKAAWQKVLMKFISDSPNLIVVSLTATPPHDASAGQWRRYQQLCGAVDEVISIPELVKSDSLCPHQDYLWMVKTDRQSIDSLARAEQRVLNFLSELNNHTELLYLLSLHDWLYIEDISLKSLLSHLDECFALLALHKTHNWRMPKPLLDALDVNAEDVGQLQKLGWQVLLQSFVDGEHYPDVPVVTAFRETLKSLLLSQRLLVNGRVRFDKNQTKVAALNKSQQRIQACYDIVELEYQQRQDWMRLVILSDFIRDEKFQLSVDGLHTIAGAYPIFHFFIHHLSQQLQSKIVLLTGRLIIVHHDVLIDLVDFLPSEKELMVDDYSEHQDFVVLNNGSDEITPALTALHKSGIIQIIIGTRALLGEGWDAPHVNALIMATRTKAFVSTNQLRGRAIRIDPNDDLKTASIWHIVAVTEHPDYDKILLEDLDRRFNTFAGIHAKHLRIESGLERLTIVDEDSGHKLSVADNNVRMKKRLEDDLFNLQARWQNALAGAEHQCLQSGLHFGRVTKNKTGAISRYLFTVDERYRQQLSKVNVLLVSIFIMWLLLMVIISVVDATIIAASATVVIFIAKQYIKDQAGMYLNPEFYTNKCAQVVLSSLQSLKMLQQSKINAGQISIGKAQNGDYRCTLSGVGRKDSHAFLEALRQMLEPISRPRYIIVLNKRATSVFAVPHVFGVNKKYAQVFFVHWQNHFKKFKKATLLSTNNEEARLLLLRTKASLYQHDKADNIRMVDRWE